MRKQEHSIRKQSHPRIVKYEELRPCFDAFIDTRSPGSDKKENFTIIGPGVSENPNQHVHIAEPHGFNIGGARQPPGCLNSQHSHLTEEVFFVHSGEWRFMLGEHGEDAEIKLSPGDLISIPTHVFRGFENIGNDIGFLWGVLGGDDPGRVLWAPQVFEMAKDYGLVLMEDGMLIDTHKGETIPEGRNVMPVTTDDQVRALQNFSAEQLRDCCIFADDKPPTLYTSGVEQRKLVGKTGKITRPHGFSIDHFRMGAEVATEPRTHNAPEVVFVHSGELEVHVNRDVWKLTPGDTATIQAGSPRRYRAASSGAVDFLRVRGNK